MARKGKTKKRLNPVVKSFSLFMMLIVSGVLLYSVFSEVLTTHELTNEIAQSNDENASLTDKKESLSTQKKNLNDTDYIIRYARAKYLATKEDGEQVFKLPQDSSTNEAATNE